MKPMSERELQRLLGHAYRPGAGKSKRPGRGGGRENYQEWTQAALEPLGKMTDDDAAKLLKRKVESVRAKRWALGIPLVPREVFWTQRELDLLGTMPDEEAASRLGRTFRAVEAKRQQMGRPPFTPLIPGPPFQYRRVRANKTQEVREWTVEETRLLGTAPAPEIARLLKRTTGSVHARRHLLKIPPFNPK